MSTVAPEALPADPAVAWPRLRRAVAFVVPRFPPDVFVLRELAELERHGQPLVVAPLLRTRDAKEPPAEPHLRRVLPAPGVWALLSAFARAGRQDPVGFAVLFCRLALACVRTPHAFVRGGVSLARAASISERLAADGVGHIHASSAGDAATAALLAAELMGATFSLAAHAPDTFVHHRLLRWKLRRAAFVRVLSEFDAGYLREHFPEAAEKLRVVPLGVHVEEGQEPPALPPAHEGLAILCVADLEPTSGLPVLLRACRRLRQQGVGFACRVVGEGTQRRELEQLIADWGLREAVELLGTGTEEEVRELMSAAHVVVQPSVVTPDGRMEATPAALAQAMALGRPVVASALAGVPELVQHERTGWPIRPDDPQALVNAIMHVVWDPGEARARGLAARQHVRELFSLERSVAAFVEELDHHNPSLDGKAAGALEPLGGVAGGLTLGTVYEGSDARVLEILLPGEDARGRVVMKVARARPGDLLPPAERARVEFEGLEAVTRLGDPACRVPRPLLLDAEAGAVVMEPCAGERLDALLRRTRFAVGSRPRAEALDALRASGDWLRRYHRQQRTWGDQGDHVEELVHRMLTDLQAIPGTNLGRGGAGAVRAALLPLIRRVGKRRTWSVALHGEFRPQNVLMDGAGPVVVDLDGRRRGLPAEDVACFLTHLELAFAIPGLRRRRLEAVRAFWAGYAPNGHSDGAAFKLCLAATGLALMARGSALTGAPPLVKGVRLAILRATLPVHSGQEPVAHRIAARPTAEPAVGAG